MFKWIFRQIDELRSVFFSPFFSTSSWRRPQAGPNLARKLTCWYEDVWSMTYSLSDLFPASHYSIGVWIRANQFFIGTLVAPRLRVLRWRLWRRHTETPQMEEVWWSPSLEFHEGTYHPKFGRMIYLQEFFIATYMIFSARFIFKATFHTETWDFRSCRGRWPVAANPHLPFTKEPPLALSSKVAIGCRLDICICLICMYGL